MESPLRYTVAMCLLALIALTLAWELWLAPLRPGGSWLALKTVPLLLPLRGVIKANTYTYRWTTMLVLAYLAEGLVRAYTDHGLSAMFASIEIVVALILFVTSIAYVRVAAAHTKVSGGKATRPT